MRVETSPAPLGAIFDTNSRGRFDLVVYGDGLLAVKGSYKGVALRAAGVGSGAAAAGWSAGTTYEMTRLKGMLKDGREHALAQKSSFFIPDDSIVGLTLRKRWYGHSLTVRTQNEISGRKFEWKQKLNDFDHIEKLLRCAYPSCTERD
jgi:hypothetical protein